MNQPRVWAGLRAPYGDYPAPGTWVHYLLLDAQGVVLYVGMSRTFASRVRHHRASPAWPWTAWVAIESEDELDAAEDEAFLIREYQPAGNMAGRA